MKHLVNNLEKLAAGTLFRSIQKENSEPENIALDQTSKELRYLQRQSQYVTEIRRVLKELQLTVSLIRGCRTVEIPEGTTRQELLAYHQGSFLTLVHQMKDKIAQLVHLMTEKTVPQNPSIEKDISLSKLLKKKKQVLQSIGIEQEVKQWDQENRTSKIAVALRKRVQHHHRVSGLKYDKDYLNINFTDILTQPNVQLSFTEPGKKQIEKMRAESTERLFSSALMKAEDTLKEIEGNVEKISGALVDYFKLPISDEEVKIIVDRHIAMLRSFDIVNRSSLSKIPTSYKQMLDSLVSKMHEGYKDQVSAVYLVGSLGRGEYEEGYSDINVYAILAVDDSSKEALTEDNEFSLRVFTKTHFLSEQGKKYRIIAKADGVLLYGTDLTNKDELPKAGLFLALLLNDDILETLDKAKRWMEENPTVSPLAISRKSRRIAKCIIDFIYCVVMANKPQYTSSRAEKKLRINEMYPENSNMIETLMNVSRYGVGDFNRFENMIEVFRPEIRKNLRKMQENQDSITKQKNKE